MGAGLQGIRTHLHRHHHLRMDERAVPRQGIRRSRRGERIHHQRHPHRHQQPAARHQRHGRRPRQLQHGGPVLRVHRHRRRRPSGRRRGDAGRRHAAQLHRDPRPDQHADDRLRGVAVGRERHTKFFNSAYNISLFIFGKRYSTCTICFDNYTFITHFS